MIVKGSSSKGIFVALLRTLRQERRASEIEYLFSVSFPLVGNPSDLFGTERKILDKPE